MSKPVVSIIIPVLNDQLGLLRCIEAISNQSYPRDQLEVIVVDNGSDLPIQLADSKGMNVHVVVCSTPGSYAARNEGVKFSTGEFLAFIDADCWPDKDWIATGLSSIEENSRDVLIGGEVNIVKPLRPSPVAIYQHLVGFGQEYNVNVKRFTGTLNLFCTRDLFFTVGFFDERLLSGGDREWSWRAANKGFDLLFDANAIVYTEPRTTLSGAIRQARRIVAGRMMLKKFHLGHLGNSGIEKRRGAIQSVFWILSRRELSFFDRISVLAVATIIRLAEFCERLRLNLGFKAERR